MNRLADTTAGNGAKARGRRQAINAQTEERRKAARTDDRERERAIRLAGVTNESSREKSYGLKTDKPGDSRVDAEGKSRTSGQRNGTREAERKTENKKERQNRTTKRGGIGPDRKTDTAGFAPGESAYLPRRQKVCIATAGRGNGSEGKRTKRRDRADRNGTRTGRTAGAGMTDGEGGNRGISRDSGVKNAFGKNQCTDNGEEKRFGRGKRTKR